MATRSAAAPVYWPAMSRKKDNFSGSLSPLLVLSTTVALFPHLTVAYDLRLLCSFPSSTVPGVRIWSSHSKKKGLLRETHLHLTSTQYHWGSHIAAEI